MIVGVPKETKTDENRVALTPPGVEQLVKAGHQVLVQKGAGIGSGFSDKEYETKGAKIVTSPDEAFQSGLVLKVKEPQEQELDLLNPDGILLTYLHLPANKPLTERLMQSGIIAVAYETVQLANGILPLLAPMSQVAGTMAPAIAESYSPKLAGGIPTVDPATYLILGGGVAGEFALIRSLQLGAQVVIAETNPSRRQYLRVRYQDAEVINPKVSLIQFYIPTADAVIGTVNLPGGRTPNLLSYNNIALMKPGAVLVDVSIDNGGCTDVSQPTTHTDPVRYISLENPHWSTNTLYNARLSYGANFVIGYFVANMPGIHPNTSTVALTNATLPYVLKLANNGVGAFREDPYLARGVNVYHGVVTCRPLAEVHNLQFRPLVELL